MVVSIVFARVAIVSIAFEKVMASFDVVVSSGAKMELYFYLLTLERSGEGE
jgi:hypothetical protein